VTKAEPLLLQDFQEKKSQIESIIHLIKNQCDDPFDESYFFREDQKRSQMLQMKGKFMNISKILDCISCEKCRLNSKVQIKGLGTAMKLLFSPNLPGITYSRLELIVSF
jgi:ERO1-like protein beta